MAKRNYSYEKRQKELAKRKKKEAKRQLKLNKKADSTEEEPQPSADEAASE